MSASGDAGRRYLSSTSAAQVGTAVHSAVPSLARQPVRRLARSVDSSMLSLLVSDRPAPSHSGSSGLPSSGASATECNCVRRFGTGLLARMLAFLLTGTGPQCEWQS